MATALPLSLAWYISASTGPVSCSQPGQILNNCSYVAMLRETYGYTHACTRSRQKSAYDQQCWRMSDRTHCVPKDVEDISSQPYGFPTEYLGQGSHNKRGEPEAEKENRKRDLAS